MPEWAQDQAKGAGARADEGSATAEKIAEPTSLKSASTKDSVAKAVPYDFEDSCSREGDGESATTSLEVNLGNDFH